MAKKKSLASQLIAVIVFVVLLIVILNMCSGDDEGQPISTPIEPISTPIEPISTPIEPTKLESRQIDASVSFRGTQFVIENRESQEWVNVRFEVNPGGLFTSGYVLKVRRVAAGTVYTVDATQFTKSGGERFNLTTHKPVAFNIVDYADDWPDQFTVEGFASYGWE